MRLLRQKKGISQRKLGAELGCSGAWICAIENGMLTVKGISKALARKLKLFFGEPIEQLLREVD
jgi:transcriptional regulator with XRE-family HTH domain